MATETLAAVYQDTVRLYGQLATHTIDAYYGVAQRALHGVLQFGAGGGEFGGVGGVWGVMGRGGAWVRCVVGPRRGVSGWRVGLGGWFESRGRVGVLGRCAGGGG